jgi:hypothetical protein
MLTVETSPTANKLIPFSVDWADPRPANFDATAAKPIAPPSVRTLTITGSQLLVGFLSFTSGIGLALWVILRLWLFEP